MDVCVCVLVGCECVGAYVMMVEANVDEWG
jgi:hypothetical protein